MKAFDSSTHTSRLIILLQILDRLHHCKKTQLLSPTAYSNANRQPELEEPIGRIYTYLYNNFREKVVLKDLADFVGQNPTSLCRYFKKSTDKSIFQVLAEIRIEYACKLLANSDLTITEGLSVPATIRRLSSSSSFRRSSILHLPNIAGKSMGLLSDGERMSVSLLNSLVSRFLRDTNGLRPVNEMRLFSLSAMLERLIPLSCRIF